MANHISPAAQLFRSMAELIDHDHTSQTDYDAITKGRKGPRSPRRHGAAGGRAAVGG